MHRRTVITTVLALALALPVLSGCAKSTTDATAILAHKGLELISNMDELASSEEYVKAMSASKELADAIALMGAGEYAAPKAVYRVSFQENMLSELLGAEDMELSDTLNAWVEGRAYASIPSQVTARSGATALAEASCVAYSESFLCPELTAPALYLYQYDGAYSAMVSFFPGQDGAVSGSALFVPGDHALRETGSAEEISAWFDERIGVIQADAEAVDWQRIQP